MSETTAPTTTRPPYADAYADWLGLERGADGVLTARFHTGGGPHTFTGTVHRQLVRALQDIGADRDNRVLVLTGTGDAFMDQIDGQSLGDITQPRVWDAIFWEGRKVLTLLADLEMPVVAAVNGPARVHAEYAVLADVVIAEEHAVFQDVPHNAFGIVPGDGVQVVWQELLGPNRGRDFLLRSRELDAAEAQRLGVVSEVVPRGASLERARTIAAELAQRPTLHLRYTSLALRQRLRRRLEEGVPYGMALEGLTAADLAHQG
ncbi:enoyl-CoA hydratase/isomerase family protein [Conexibacter sp. SYSU D00693]|uniref:enoyl-CoA hydratase/isomerase family protein n=1 Tax=Conexibacter sp. SYSU D00693 TaxID=2812560 RepID=UPI00196AF9DA|nr:enoyl-CoA hydratase/isomerase family protein [Conexibacter sp. SYSU D00693]